MRKFGIDVQASLKLTSTTLDLSQRLTPTSGSKSSGSSSGIGSGTGTGNGQGSDAGPGQGSNSGSNSGSGSGHNLGSSSPTTGAGQPANPVQSKPATQSAGLLPWVYGILGIIAAAIIGSAVWIARRRMKKAPSQLLAVQP
jgi:cobalamin biosynthesis Mg chelatase CobN